MQLQFAHASLLPLSASVAPVPWFFASAQGVRRLFDSLLIAPSSAHADRTTLESNLTYGKCRARSKKARFRAKCISSAEDGAI